MFKSRLLDYFSRWNTSQPITSIAERIAARLLDDPRTQDEQIDVLDDHGRLILTGKVNSDSVRKVAEEIAREEGNVLRLTNELKIKRRRK